MKLKLTKEPVTCLACTTSTSKRSGASTWCCTPHGVLVFLLLAWTWTGAARATGTVTPEPKSTDYDFVSHYRIRINAAPSTVWKHLIDLRSWMYEFEMAHVSGPRRETGEILRLYAGQGFLVEITKAIPGKVLVIANLPSNFKGEYSTGVGVTTLNRSDGGTIVDLTMSRRYTWRGKGPDPVQARRKSANFNATTDAMWEKFLARLRSLSEGT